jgi:hypothetical protein
MTPDSLGKALLAIGLGVVILGGLVLLLGRLGFSRIPGSVVYRGERLTVFIPVGFSIIASIVLTVLLNLFLRR